MDKKKIKEIREIAYEAALLDVYMMYENHSHITDFRMAIDAVVKNLVKEDMEFYTKCEEEGRLHYAFRNALHELNDEQP